DVDMADFGIAHLPVGQADVPAGGVQQRVRTARPQPVEARGARLAHGVVGALLAPAPAVQDYEHHRAPLLHRLSSVSAPLCGIAPRASTGPAVRAFAVRRSMWRKFRGRTRSRSDVTRGHSASKTRYARRDDAALRSRTTSSASAPPAGIAAAPLSRIAPC